MSAQSLRGRARTLALLLALGCGAAACSQNGTGVLLTINGSGLTADQLTITANYSGNSVTHKVPDTARALSFPTTLVIALPDKATTVTLSVTALSGGSAVAGGSTAAIAVGAHQLVDASVDLMPGTIPPDGGAGQICGKVSVLVDDFAAGTSDPLFLPYASNGATVTPTGGQLALVLPATAPGSTETGYPSQAYYDVSDSSVSIEVAKNINTSTTAYQGLSVNRDNDDFLEISQESNFLNLDNMAGGKRNRLMSIPYSLSQHRWWRIRESAGTTFFETAPDGTTWTSRAMVGTPSWVDFAYVNIFAGADGNVSNGGEVHFTQLNNGTAVGSRCAASSLTDNFTDAANSVHWLPSTTAHCAINATGGQLDFTLQPPPSGCEYISSYSFDLTGSSVVVQAPKPPAKADGAVAWLRVVTDETMESGYELSVDEGVLQALRKNEDGSSNLHVTTGFDSSLSWWRIRESGGMLLYEVAPDGKNWSQFASEAVSYPVTAIRVHLGVSVYDQAATAPGHVDFANLNLPPQ